MPSLDSRKPASLRKPTIPTYIINLRSRIGRRQHILNEFHSRDEFDIKVIDACEHAIGAIGLWNSIRHILQNLVKGTEEFILICEDDHQFTEHYSTGMLFDCIAEANKREACILSGGVSWFDGSLNISRDLFWVNKFSGLQFTIIFNRFFKSVLEANFKEYDAADYKISSLTGRNFFIYPFISVQKEFGYSDVTTKNNMGGRVDELFAKSSASVQVLKDVSDFYKRSGSVIENVAFESLDNLSISTYIVNLSNRADRREHIEKQFAGRNEFDVVFIEACRHRVGAVGLWNSMRKIVEMAVAKEDDVIIICEDDHEFTEYYSKYFLLENILGAYRCGAALLCGGIGGFDIGLPVARDRFWISSFFCTQFIVLYRNIFQKILEERFDDTVTADGILSNITSNKMVFFPFISVQRDFGYSDVTPSNNAGDGLITKLFNETSRRLEKIHAADNLYGFL